jgi:muramoyltetrapeptide carboxypeptidase
MSQSAQRPPLLAPGARVALVSPAGPLRGEQDVERAVANARTFGWEPVVGAHALARQGYLAGSDGERLDDLNGALRDSRIDGVWCLRGGYGTMRLLDAIDYDALRRRPKPVIGFSDITSLHFAIRQRCGIISYHGPTARAELTPFSRDSLERAVIRGEDSCGVAAAARALRSGRARGPLIGGNLALVTALLGTPLAPDFDGAILVLEDVNEPLYRIDRMLQQLRLAGVLARVGALVLGAFTERGDESDALGRSLETVLCEAALKGPCLMGAPVGHIDDQWTLPLGATAELDAEPGRLTIVDGDAA